MLKVNKNPAGKKIIISRPTDPTFQFWTQRTTNNNNNKFGLINSNHGTWFSLFYSLVLIVCCTRWQHDLPMRSRPDDITHDASLVAIGHSLALRFGRLCGEKKSNRNINFTDFLFGNSLLLKHFYYFLAFLSLFNVWLSHLI